MTKAMGAMNLYREELKAMARSLDQEGLSQTAIAKELGVTQQTISKWLNLSTDDDRQQNLCKTPSDTNLLLPTSKPIHYLVVCESVEKFRPPDGITFPLIIADPPWNISDPGHKRERKVRPRPFTNEIR